MSDEGEREMSHESNIFRQMTSQLQRYRGDVRIEVSSIYGVPPSARNADPSAFEPEVVSIGPYNYHKHPKLQAMQEHKWWYMHNLLGRPRGRRSSSSRTDELSDSADEVLKRCIDKVWPSLAQAMRCYKVHNYSNYDFVIMLVLDGCFILELFLTSFYHDAAEYDFIHAVPRMFSEIWNDLLKLGNQIPFFILQDLFTAIFKNNNIIASSTDDQPSIIISMPPPLEKLAFRYLKHGPLTLADRFELQDEELEAPKSSLRYLMLNIEGVNMIYHLLHFYHKLLRPSTGTSSTTRDDDDAAAGTTPAGNINNNDLQPRGYRSSSAISCMFFEKVMKKKINLMPLNMIRRRRSVVDDGHRPDKYTMIPCVGELCDAGITVSCAFRKPEEKKKKKAASCATQLDVAFKDGVLHVPRLTVGVNANAVFRNLLTLEMFYPGISRHVTSYTLFLDCIVNTAKDVAILEQRGIIRNMLGSKDEVAQLFNRLVKGLPFIPESNYLHKVFTEVNEYCESKWHKHRASCMRDYFGSPWSAISLLAAVALLLMTLIQVVFAILSSAKAEKMRTEAEAQPEEALLQCEPQASWDLRGSEVG